MGNIIKITSAQLFGLDKDKIIGQGQMQEKKEKEEEEKEEKIRKKKFIYPIPLRGRGLYAFIRLMNE
jgi:hypothetical protein